MLKMNWQRFRDFFKVNRIDEDHFVLGIDLGSATSSIAYFDPLRKDSEVLDISGGYGKTSTPTALQYIAENAEWIFGEYAILNANGDDAVLSDFVTKLGNSDYLDIGGEAKPAHEVCAIYIKELVANCRNINPKAQIAGIISVVPDFISREARKSLKDAYLMAGFDDVLIDMTEEREALLAYYLHNEQNKADHRLMLLDFGARGMRSSIYNISGGKLDCLSAALDETLSTSVLDSSIYNLFCKYYCDNKKIDKLKLSKGEQAGLLIFTHQHKDLLFQYDDGRDLKLYYNFPFPPFSQIVSFEDVYSIVAPIERKIKEFIRGLIEKIPNNEKNIDVIIASGGGFEMSWARRRLSELFPDTAAYGNIKFYKNPKGILSEGASLLAASKLGVLPEININISDKHKIPWDIGINITKEGQKRFYAIVERGSSVWQKPKSIYAILQDDDKKIDLIKRDSGGREIRIGAIVMDGLPQRPAGTTKIALSIAPVGINNYMINIKDLGFGEIFPASDFVYSKELKIDL